MPQKRYRPSRSCETARGEVLIGQGKKYTRSQRRSASSEVSYYRWRKEYGGLKVSQASV